MAPKCDKKSFTEKVKAVFDALPKLGFDSSLWNKTLKAEDDTTQKVFDRINALDLKPEDRTRIDKIIFNSANWDKNLTPADNTLQKVLDKVDDFNLGGGESSSTTEVLLKTGIPILEDFINEIKIIEDTNTGKIYTKKSDNTIVQIGDTSTTPIPTDTLSSTKGRFLGNFLDTSDTNIPTPKNDDWIFVSNNDPKEWDGSAWVDVTLIDKTIELQELLDNNQEVKLGSGLIAISDVIKVRLQGQTFLGSGMRNTFLINKTNDKRLIDIGDIYNENGFARHGEVGNFSIIGNANTDAGLTQWSNDSMRILQKNENGDANVQVWRDYLSSEGWNIHDIGFQTIGSGSAIRLFAWSNSVNRIYVYKYPGETILTKAGMEIGFETNGCDFDNIYISHTAEETIKSTADGSHGVIASCNFGTIVLQNGGRANNTVPFPMRGWFNCTIENLYLEFQDFGTDDNQPAITIDARCINTKINAIYALKAAATMDALIVNNGVGNRIGNIWVNSTYNTAIVMNGNYDPANKVINQAQEDSYIEIDGNFKLKDNAVGSTIYDAQNRKMLVKQGGNIEYIGRGDDDTSFVLTSSKPKILLNDTSSPNNAIYIQSDGGKYSVIQKSTGKKVWEIDIASGMVRVPIRNVVVDNGDTHVVNFTQTNYHIIRPSADGNLEMTLDVSCIGQRGHIIIYNSNHITGYNAGYHFENSTAPTLSGKSVLEYMVQTGTVVLITNVTTNVGAV